MPNKIEWAVPEYNYYKKTKSWFTIAGIIFIILLLWSIWTKNVLFVMFIVLSYFLIIIFALKKPKIAYISIQPKGININANFYDFDKLKSFWIFYTPTGIKEISLQCKKKTIPYIRIPLGDQNPVRIRKFLIKYIPEDKQEESLIDNLFRSLKF
ncbi:hypothetical protein ACFLZ0_00855 [Patescibacteria group bacterium]